MRRPRFLYLMLSFFLFFNIVHSKSLVAANCIFTNGGGDNDWSNPLNWDCGIVPGSLDNVSVNTGTVTINSNRVVNNLTFSGGIINGTANLEITNIFFWDAYSTFDGTGTITLASSCTGTIFGTSSRYLYQPFVNNGNLTHMGGDLRFGAGSSFQNNGTFLVNGASYIYNSTGSNFTNNGFFNKEGATLYTINVAFNQIGSSQFNLNNGSVILNGGGVSTGGTLTIASGKSLAFKTGTSTFSSGVSFSGDGDMDFQSGTTTIDGTWSINGSTSISGGIISFNSATAVTFPILTMSGGTLGGSSDYTVSTSFDWTGYSTFNGTGTFTLSGTCLGNISGSSSRRLYQAFVNNGTLNHTGADFRFYSGSSFVNNGTFTANDATYIYNSSGGGFTNNGIINKNGTSIYTINVPLNMTGSSQFNVNDGIVILNGGGASTAGTFSISNGKTLNLKTTNSSFGASVIFTGDGNVGVQSGIHTIEGTWNINGMVGISGGTAIYNSGSKITFPILSMSGGTLEGNSDFEVTNTFDWTAYSTLNGTGTFTLTGACTATISGTSSRYLYQQIINNGNLTHSGGDFRFSAGGSFINNGTYTIDGASSIYNSSSGGITNIGIFNKNGISTYTINPAFNLEGTGQVNVNDGVLILNGGSTSTGGTYTVASGKTLTLSTNDCDFESSVNMTGDGNVSVISGTHIFEGSWTINGITGISGGELSFNTASTISFPTLNISGGTLNGSSNFSVTGVFDWTGYSTLGGTGILTLANGSTGSVSGTSSRLLEKELINEGNFTHSGADLRFQYGGSLENNGNYIVDGGMVIYTLSGGDFTNNSIFTKNDAGSVYNINVNFINNALGTVKGVGTIDFFSFTNNGIVAPGLSPGALTINGDYVNGSKLEIEFDNATHDELFVSNDITLGGELEVTFTGIVPGGTYTIISSTGGNITGSFATETIPANYLLQYNTTSVQLIENPLPVEIIDFTAFQKLESVYLQWETASESDNDYFQIERSIDGFNFKRIGKVDGAGTTDQIQNYTFRDHNPLIGENYYRLKQVDFDGAHNFSKVVQIDFVTSQLDLQVYPNPSKGKFTFSFPYESMEFPELRVYNMNGILVYRRTRFTDFSGTLDLEFLGPGVYILGIFKKADLIGRKTIGIQ